MAKKSKIFFYNYNQIKPAIFQAGYQTTGSTQTKKLRLLYLDKPIFVNIFFII